MEYIIGTAMQDVLSYGNVTLDVSAHPTTLIPGPIEKISVINSRIEYGGHPNLHPAVRTTFHNTVSLMQISQAFRERFAAIECLRDVAGIDARKLKRDLGANREHGRAHLRGILVQELVGRDD